MNLGKISQYVVLRETNLGYVLVQDDVEYFLHHNECCGKSLKSNEVVNAFLYVDKKGRQALTLSNPLIEVDKIAFLEVVEVKEEVGIFLNIGISKDILLSRDDLPRSFSEWPKINDFILCELRCKINRLVLKPVSKNQIIKRKESMEVKKLEVGANVSGIVYRIVPEGISVVTNDLDIIFVFKSNFRKKYRLGESVSVKILEAKLDDYLGTINKDKTNQIQDDKKIILDYLLKHNGVMLITEKSEPELITKLFNMSKSAFKNALGSLYKDKIIEIQKDKIIVIDESYFN